MRIFEIANWSGRDAVQTRDGGCDGKFVGIAIGPNSDEGRVLVDGQLLQAGRVLPLRSSSYQIQRVNGLDEAGTLTSITRLQLQLFEDPSELAAECARPNHQRSGRVTGDATITVPFRGRRQLAIVIRNRSDNGLAYVIAGRRFFRAAKAVEAITMASGTVFTQSIASFVVGGTDNAECYDEISFAGDAALGTDGWDYEIESIGEIGAR